MSDLKFYDLTRFFGHIRHKCAAGIMDIDVVASEDRTFMVRMTQAPPTFTSLNLETVSRITSGLGIDVDDRDPRCPIEVVSTGHSKILVGVKNSQVLNSLSPDLDRLTKLSSETGVNGYFVFILRPDDTEYIAESRMFAPAIGIPEDPVTGKRKWSARRLSRKTWVQWYPRRSFQLPGLAGTKDWASRGREGRRRNRQWRTAECDDRRRCGCGLLI